MTPRTLVAIRILALVAAYRERFGEQAFQGLAVWLFTQIETDQPRPAVACGICGTTITQKARGRSRKYCDVCAASLNHLSVPAHLRKMARKKRQIDRKEEGEIL